MRLDEPPLARQSHVDKVFVELEVAQRGDDVALEVVPLQAEVLVRHHGGGCSSQVFSPYLTVSLYTHLIDYRVYLVMLPVSLGIRSSGLALGLLVV